MVDIISETLDREIVTTRIINEPRDLVYAAWSDPDHLKNWWGPKGFTNTFTEFDLRPGGKWSLSCTDLKKEIILMNVSLQ